MNKMTAQKERILDDISKVEKLHLDQDLFLKWETVECKKIIKTVEEYKKITKTVEVRLEKIKTKTYRKYDEL